MHPLRVCPGRGGGGSPLCKRYTYLPTHRVGFLRRFGLKMSIHFANFGLESGMVFEGSTRLHERIYRFNSKWVRKNEKYANSKWIWRIFCLRSNLSNDNIISDLRPSLKTDAENFGLKSTSSAILAIQWNLLGKSLRPSHTSAYIGSATDSWLAEWWARRTREGRTWSLQQTRFLCVWGPFLHPWCDSWSRLFP